MRCDAKDAPLDATHAQVAAPAAVVVAGTDSHGLRNPLSSIRTSAPLARDNGNSDDTNHALDQIVLEADRMECWVRRYLGLLSDHAQTTETCSLRVILDEAILKPYSSPAEPLRSPSNAANAG